MMDRDELAFAGAARQAELIRSGDVTSRELVILYLERIERLDPQLNAFRKVMDERAMVDAQQADGRRGAGDERPLLGVPIAVKDVEDVTGEVTGWGSAANHTPASQDSEIVRRLRSAGAVIIGKTNTPEGAIIGDTEGPAFGITRNPWNTDRSPGGSSGGSAAAVAAGLCGGHRLGWGRVDPHPRLELRPGRTEAHPRPHPTNSAEGALVRLERGGLRGAQRRGRRSLDEHRSRG